MIHEPDTVVLTVDFPDSRLKAGDIGTVVHVYGSGERYEVEAITLDGKTIDVITARASEIRPIGEMEVMHARPLQR